MGLLFATRSIAHEHGDTTMTTTTHQGAPQFPTVLGSIPPSTREEMDAAIEALQAHKDEWVAFSIHDRIILIDRMIKDFAAIASRWVDASIQAKGISGRFIVRR